MMALLGILNLVQRAYKTIRRGEQKNSEDKSCQTEDREINRTGSTSSGHGGAAASLARMPERMPQENQHTELRRRPQLEDRVLIIGSGQRFHNQGCGMVRANVQRVRGVSRSQALRSGLTPCQQCGG